MSKKALWFMIGVLVIASMVLAACQPQVIEKTVEVPVEQTVIITEVVEGESKEVVVTATPAPVDFKSADPSTLYDITGAGDTDTLDPAWNYESAGDSIILNVYDQLVTYAGPSATEFVPALADDWDISEDGTVYTFYLREGVMFHEGQEMTAEDVAYTFQRGVLQGGTWSPQWLFTEPFFGTGIYDIAELVDPSGALDDAPEDLQAADPEALMAACERVQEVVVADEEAGTVTFNLVQSWGPFLATLAQSWGSVIDKDWAIENGTWDGDCATWQNYYGVTSENAPLREVANGTGPYMLDHWTPGEETVLVRNESWWRDEPTFEGGPVQPSIDRVVRRLVGEWGTRFAMVQAGDADLVYVPRENVAQIDPMVGEWCDWNQDALSFDCGPTDSPDQPLQLHYGAPSASRTDAFFVFDINVDGGNQIGRASCRERV
jgi:peptide/nickel transport system substrate-binding protein